jgi:hypothetical protein
MGRSFDQAAENTIQWRRKVFGKDPDGWLDFGLVWEEFVQQAKPGGLPPSGLT